MLQHINDKQGRPGPGPSGGELGGDSGGRRRSIFLKLLGGGMEPPIDVPQNFRNI